MASNPFELYVVIAPMGLAFAGFGSLASRLGQSRAGDDATVDATRFTLMLFASLSAVFLGLLPATLVGLLLDEQLAVRISAIIAVVAILSYAATGLRRAVKLRKTPGFSRVGVLSNLGFAFIAFAAFLLCSLGLAADRIAAVYLFGLMGLLGSSATMFSRVIISMLRPHDQGEGA